MGVMGNLRAALGYSATPRPDYLASPFTEGTLNKIVYSDIFGANYAPMTRAEAMTIPSLSKARNLIAATIAKLPLKAQSKTGLLADELQPAWTYRTDTILGPFQRMLWTIDDLLFYGRSLWSVVRGSDGFILSAERVPIEWWKVSHEGVITIHDEPANANEIIYFPGPIEGLLDKDGSSLRAAKSIAASVETRVKSPIPVMELHATGVEEFANISDEEAEALVASYNKARRSPEGATMFTPVGIQLIAHGEKADSGFMVEGRNQVRLDVANMTGVPVALLDGSTSTASLTYSTQEGRRNEFVDFSLALWMEAITDRLSADDVVPRGQSVVFDQTDFLTTMQSPTGPEKQD
jgi:hypothetical protein